MTQKIKTIGLLAILSLAMIAVAPNLIDDAEARKNPESQTNTPHQQQQEQQGARQVVSEPPSLALIQLEFTNENSSVKEKYTTSTAPVGDDGIESFMVAYIVTNEGDGEVRNVEVLFKSDFETVQTKLVGELDGNHSVVSTTIKAIDPNSIRATIGSFEIIN